MDCLRGTETTTERQMGRLMIGAPAGEGVTPGGRISGVLLGGTPRDSESPLPSAKKLENVTEHKSRSEMSNPRLLDGPSKGPIVDNQLDFDWKGKDGS